MVNHDHTSLILYLSGELPASEKASVESHLQTCGECNEFLSFVRGFKATLKKTAPGLLQPDTPCPDADTLVAFADGELDEQVAQLVRQHTIFCRDCLEELDLLRQARAAAGIQEEVWDMFQKLKDKVIEITRTYGPGAMIGSIRVLAEQPVLARGGKPSQAASKVLEASVGENTYSIEVAVTEEGSVSCDIAGVRTPVKTPVNISVSSEKGDELISTESDAFGNSRFLVPSAELPDDLLLFTLKLQDAEQRLLLRVPERQKPV